MRNKIISFISIIVLGALGSGLWDTCFKPIWLYTTDRFMALVISYATTYEQQVFKEISQGFHEAPSLALLNYFYFLMALFLVLLLFFNHHRFKEVFSSKKDYLVPELDDVENLNFCELKAKLIANKKEIERKMKEYDLEHEKNKEIVQRCLIYMGACVLFLISFSFFSIAKNSVVNSCILSFNHNCAILNPYLSEDKKKRLISEFSQIENFEDYKKVISTQVQIAKTNKIELKKLSFALLEGDFEKEP